MDDSNNADPQAGHSTRGQWSRLTHPLSVIGFVLLTPVLLGLAYDVYQSHQLNAELESLRAQGLPTTEEELYESNTKQADGRSAWVAALKATYPAVAAEEMIMLSMLGVEGLPIRPDQMTPSELKYEQRALSQLSPVRQLLINAARKEGPVPVELNSGSEYTPSHPTLLLYAWQLMALDARVACQVRDFERAKEDLSVMLVMIQIMQEIPVLDLQHRNFAMFLRAVSVAEFLLGEANLTDEELQELQRTLRSLTFQDACRKAIIGKRATLLSAADEISQDFVRISLKRQILYFYGEAIQAFSDPRQMGKQILDRLSAERRTFPLSSISKIDSLIAHYVPLPFQMHWAIAMSSQAKVRCLNLALACKRHQLLHGRFPEEISQLDPEWIGPEELRKELLTDPYCEAPIRMRNEPDRILFYCVGENLADDGGDIASLHTMGKTDKGVTLWKESRRSR